MKVKDPTSWDVIIGGMVGVMSPGGTAYRAQAGAPYQIAGKTGTAQVFTIGQTEKYKESEVAERLRDHALFIAFAPGGCTETCGRRAGRKRTSAAAARPRPSRARCSTRYLAPTGRDPAAAGHDGRAAARRSRGMRTEIAGPGYSSRAQRTLTLTGRLLAALHLDGPLLLSLVAVCCAGLVVLYSAAGEDVHIFLGQAARMGLGLGVLTLVAQVPPRIMRSAPFLYAVGVLLLVAVAAGR